MPFTFEKESLESKKYPRTFSYHRMMIRIDFGKNKNFHFVKQIWAHICFSFMLFLRFSVISTYTWRLKVDIEWKRHYLEKSSGGKLGMVMYFTHLKGLVHTILQFLELIRLLSSQNVFFRGFSCWRAKMLALNAILKSKNFFEKSFSKYHLRSKKSL